MRPEYALLFIVLLGAVICDLRTHRIPNRLCAAGAAAGLIFRAAAGIPGGGEGSIGLILTGVTGMVVPVILLFPLFWFGMMGAGDIKLFAAAGSFFGPALIIRHIAAALAAGAVGAVFLLWRNRNLKERLLYFTDYWRKGGERGKYHDMKRDGSRNTMHFSVPVMVGFLAVVFIAEMGR